MTLPLPSADPHGTVGGVKQPLVALFLGRLRAILQDPDSQPYAEVLSAREARWQVAMPDALNFPVNPRNRRTTAACAP